MRGITRPRSLLRTTGKTGLHILLPLGRQCTYAQSRTLGELLLARVVLRELDDIATVLFADPAATRSVAPATRVREPAPQTPESVAEWLEVAERDERHAADLWKPGRDYWRRHGIDVGALEAAVRAKL